MTEFDNLFQTRYGISPRTMSSYRKTGRLKKPRVDGQFRTYPKSYIKEVHSMIRTKHYI